MVRRGWARCASGASSKSCCIRCHSERHARPLPLPPTPVAACLSCGAHGRSRITFHGPLAGGCAERAISYSPGTLAITHPRPSRTATPSGSNHAHRRSRSTRCVHSSAAACSRAAGTARSALRSMQRGSWVYVPRWMMSSAARTSYGGAHACHSPVLPSWGAAFCKK